MQERRVVHPPQSAGWCNARGQPHSAWRCRANDTVGHLLLARPAIQPFVGLYGAIEIEFINGPVFSETEYVAGGEPIGLTDSPKTEVLWREMLLKKGTEPIARMIKMDRLMKQRICRESTLPMADPAVLVMPCPGN